MSRTYDQFISQASEITHLRSVLQGLSWDQETVMPEQGATHRAAQVSTIAVLHHQRLTDPRFGELIADLERQPGQLDTWGKASVREARRQFDKATKLPPTLVRDLAETTALAYEAWVKARSEADFPGFAPWLKKIVALKRSEAECLREDGKTLYDALLDEYEPGMTVERLDVIFSEIQPRLTGLLARITSSPQPRPLPSGPFPVHLQESIGREILTSMGFNWKAGRLDTSPHPFCSGFSPQDVRITTRYSTTEVTKALFGTMHECGHALYEQGLPADFYGAPACDAISLGVHESQSRLWENQVGRSLAFWESWFPKLQRSFAPHFDKFSIEDFVHSVNRVAPSLIRIEADEVTYGLHVILRYELEKALIDGASEVDDLEANWSQKMSDYLDVTPRNSAEGALQDTHWSQGLIGYFPTYLLGNLYAAQLFASVQREIPDLERSIARGELIPLREWLREKVHGHAKTLTADELIERATGAPLTATHFLEYLDGKFGRLYDL